ncbi:sulfite exporter TauE/SafE family protein [Fusobacterium russii]|uniref:sulfite exporter TauE/SafE family protein n=1 Tax=Fusobacterium russii TaxID=854 RepID=UPI000399FC10|nr:sulfite exporter TauE/SafE family protein [Fusobacterium russii]
MIFGFLVALITSIVGSITGVGSGILMKPILDLFSSDSVDAINIMSSITVFAMSLSAMIKELKNKVSIDYNTVIFLSVGSIIGGITGKRIFEHIKQVYGSGIVMTQSAVFALLMFIIIIYLLKGQNLKTYRINSKIVVAIVGLLLGFISAFLGIGGGPLNVVLLIFLFSMSTKEASLNSIFIIFFSQIASLLYGHINYGMPNVNFLILSLMVIGGVVGGILGRAMANYFSDSFMKKMFMGAILFSFIMGITHLSTVIF